MEAATIYNCSSIRHHTIITPRCSVHEVPTHFLGSNYSKLHRLYLYCMRERVGDDASLILH